MTVSWKWCKIETVAMEEYYDITLSPPPSNSTSTSDLELPWRSLFPFETFLTFIPMICLLFSHLLQAFSNVIFHTAVQQLTRVWWQCITHSICDSWASCLFWFIVCHIGRLQLNINLEMMFHLFSVKSFKNDYIQLLICCASLYRLWSNLDTEQCFLMSQHEKDSRIIGLCLSAVWGKMILVTSSTKLYSTFMTASSLQKEVVACWLCYWISWYQLSINTAHKSDFAVVCIFNDILWCILCRCYMIRYGRLMCT